MRKQSLIFVTALLLSCAIIPVSSFASDSTKLSVLSHNPVLPDVVHTDECIDAGTIKAGFFGNSGGTGDVWNWSKSICPAGYIPRALHAYVSIWLGAGSHQWQISCCKAKVKYK